MLKKAAIFVVACLATAGTADASMNDVGHETAGACPEHGTVGPIGDLGVGADITIGTIDFCRMTPTTGHFLGEEVEHLDVQMDIGLCSGPLCRKEMRFHLTCQDADGYTKDIYSPYYKNYATQGMVTRRYEFADPALAKCQSVPTVAVEWQYGWQDAID